VFQMLNCLLVLVLGVSHFLLQHLYFLFPLVLLITDACLVLLLRLHQFLEAAFFFVVKTCFQT